MVETHIHGFEKRKATFERPYHFVDSGLRNVYLTGIDYRICRTCQQQSADIPALRNLLETIGRTLVGKEAPLSGPEIRFLRKRLGKKAAEFARIVGVTPENMSRWENGHVKASQSADKLIRIYYSLLSGDRGLKNKVDEHMEEWLSTLSGEYQLTDIRAKKSRNSEEWTAEAVPAIA